MQTKRFYRSIIYNMRNKIYFFLKTFLQNPPYNIKIHNKLISTDDPVRYTTMALAINTIKKTKLKGSFAEIGVYRGDTSKIIHTLEPKIPLYLFDTFEGFPSKFLTEKDERFKDTSREFLKQTIGDLNNIIIRKGIFPDTTKGLEQETFSFVSIDLDIFDPTFLALDFFYPRLVSGGYIFVHDYNNPLESDRAVYKAVNKYIKDKKEKLIELSDKWGSVVIRKC